LLTNADITLGETSNKTSQSPQTDIILIGFSKGCAVLNELLHELPAIIKLRQRQKPPLNSEESATLAFAERVASWCFLDGGHNGRERTWTTEASTIACVGSVRADKQAVTVRVEVTPYEMSDTRRPHIGQQCTLFCDAAAVTQGVSFRRTLHFADRPRSIENHFQVLQAFSAY